MPWFSWTYVRENFDTLRDATLAHVTMTLQAVLIATVIAVPLAVVAYRVRWLAGPILAFSGVLYTIPALALFVILYPFVVGDRTQAVVVGLVLYALLIIVRNALTGLRQVPPDVREAASGIGYGRLGRLLRVELPLALPGILTGIRLATVSTVALVTVGMAVGAGGLGQLIIRGFQRGFYKPEIVTASLLCLVLALVFDLLLVGLGRLVTPWSRR